MKGLQMCDDSWCRGLSEVAAGLQSARRRIMLCLMMGELVGRWEERGNPLTAAGTEERAGNALCQNQGEASCGERMKAGLVILTVWKYKESHSFEVLCMNIYTELWYDKLRQRKSQPVGADKSKQQTGQ